MPAKDIDEGFYDESGNINKMTFQGRQVFLDICVNTISIIEGGSRGSFIVDIKDNGRTGGGGDHYIGDDWQTYENQTLCVWLRHQSTKSTSNSTIVVAQIRASNTTMVVVDKAMISFVQLGRAAEHGGGAGPHNFSQDDEQWLFKERIFFDHSKSDAHALGRGEIRGIEETME
ncbi:hypothetical protein P692DRAFT_201806095 [Suillus brevipes Sb2]|nr:hypothetical protein P692DRAFT_201806095 [Suillus brevipes Sb2]